MAQACTQLRTALSPPLTGSIATETVPSSEATVSAAAAKASPLPRSVHGAAAKEVARVRKEAPLAMFCAREALRLLQSTSEEELDAPEVEDEPPEVLETAADGVTPLVVAPRIEGGRSLVLPAGGEPADEPRPGGRREVSQVAGAAAADGLLEHEADEGKAVVDAEDALRREAGDGVGGPGEVW